MISRFEQRLQRARDRFVREVAQIVEEMTIEAVDDAFALALVRRPPLPVPLPDNSPQMLQVAGDDTSGNASSTATTNERLLACIREAPGSHVGELSTALGMRSSTIRRHLRKLVHLEVIRIETRRDSRLGGQQLQTYFPRSDGDDVHAAPPNALAQVTV
jgi:DNA-binding transcriptional ArsR family regulator